MLERLRRRREEGPGAHFTSATFCPYGLDDQWTGLRSFGGWGASNDEVTQLTLAHGDAPWDSTSPNVRVETQIPGHIGTDGTRMPITGERAFLAQQLLNSLWRQTGQLPTEARRAAYPTESGSSDPTGPWERLELDVDGAPVLFRTLGIGSFWLALAQHRDMLIGIESQSWPQATTGLVTVRDFRPYTEGSREIRVQFPRPPD
ncbi:MAG: hypothetical protein ACRDZV_07060 [Acidimicrobiia bacterium]